MKKRSLFALLFVGVLLSNCQKESFKQNKQNQESGRVSSNQQPINLFKPKESNIPTLKSVTIPEFDFENPSYSEQDSLSIISYAGEGFDNRSNDNWAYHSFSFTTKTGKLDLIYHYYKTGDISNSDVYDENGTYLFTYSEDNGEVTVDHKDPQSLPQEFYWCVEYYEEHYTVVLLALGGYTYVVAKCYYKWVR